MADDIVEHLTAVDILENHVVVMLVDDHLAHAADVRVVKEHGERGFSERADLLRSVFRRLLRRRLRVRGRRDAAGGLGGDAWEDLDGELRSAHGEHGHPTPHRPSRRRTFSPVTL